MLREKTIILRWDRLQFISFHSIESGNPFSDMGDYKIIEKGYKNNVRKRKIAEALLIKEIKLTLSE